MRIDAPKAAERKRRLRKNLAKEGRTPTRKQLLMCQWVVVFTNAGIDLIDAETVTQLYRARWMVETFFKGMKSGQNLENWSRHRTNENTIQCLSYAHMIVGILSLNLWRVMGCLVNADVAENRDAGNGESQSSSSLGASQTELKSIGPLKALEALVPLLRKVFDRTLRGGALMSELQRITRYAVQEKRKRPTLDALVLRLLT